MPASFPSEEKKFRKQKRRELFLKGENNALKDGQDRQPERLRKDEITATRVQKNLLTDRATGKRKKKRFSPGRIIKRKIA